VRAVAWVAALLASVVAANWLTATFGLVSIGFGLAVTAGTFAAGFALVARDGLQLSTARKWAVPGAILAGVLVSWWVTTPALAVASALAFAAAELTDWAVFTRLRGRSIPLAVVVSSLVAAPVDTVAFLYLAGFGLSWQAVAGQVVVKTAAALIFAAYLGWRGRDVSVRR
jgi:uncharacterized PurR-regulated membrane protein YhhQ (DUF165 family)